MYPVVATGDWVDDGATNWNGKHTDRRTGLGEMMNDSGLVM